MKTVEFQVRVSDANAMESVVYCQRMGWPVHRKSFKMPKVFKVEHIYSGIVLDASFTKNCSRYHADIGKMLTKVKELNSSKTYSGTLESAYTRFENDMCGNCSQRLVKLIKDKACCIRSKTNNSTGAWQYSTNRLINKQKLGEHTVNCAGYVAMEQTT